MDFSALTSFLPAQITFTTVIKFLALASGAILVLGLLFRLLFGRKSALNKAVCAAIGVLCIYVVTMIVYTFSPGNLEQYLVPLPFVKFSGSYLYLMSFAGTDFSAVCTQILNMVILVFLYNLVDALLPDGEEASPVNWFLLRYLTIIAAMLIHYVVTSLTRSFLPDLLVTYGPAILLVCLVASLLMGVFSLILGLVLTVVNPIFGLLFTFFFSNKIGKQLSKAMLTAGILSILVAVLGHFGFSIISISATALLSYIPLLAVLMALWYFIGRKL